MIFQTSTPYTYAPGIVGLCKSNIPNKLVWYSKHTPYSIYTPAHENTLSIQSIPTVYTYEPAFLQLYRCNVYIKNLKCIKFQLWST
jgi:hypothetical protein